MSGNAATWNCQHCATSHVHCCCIHHKSLTPVVYWQVSDDIVAVASDDNADNVPAINDNVPTVDDADVTDAAAAAAVAGGDEGDDVIARNLQKRE